MPSLNPRRQRSESSLCKAVLANGNPCKAYAGSSGYCTAHSGEHDMRELGRLGGRGRTRSMLGLTDEVADGRLRDKAKRRLEELLDSEDEGKRLAAARALYSYGPTRPPAEQGAPDTERDRAVELWREQLDWEKVLLGLWEAGVLRCGTCDGPMGGGDTVHGPNPPVIRAERLAKEMGGRLNNDESETKEEA